MEFPVTRTREIRKLFARAQAAGEAAAEACQPVGMLVGTPRDMMASIAGGDGGGFDPERPVYAVEGGVCGFAWVSFDAQRGGPSRKFVNRAVKMGLAAKGNPYQGTAVLRVRAYGQSMQRKEAFAYAFARVIREAGIEGLGCYGQSRMD